MGGPTKFVTRLLKGVFGTPDARLLSALEPLLKQINALEPAMRAKSDLELFQTTARMREQFAAGKSLDDMQAEAFASVRESGRRILGMRHYDVQMIGASILHKGDIAEMVTGEGKTLVATPAVFLNAIPDKGVHVVTVNDYLAKRDRDWMAPVYEALGLSVGVIQHDMDNADRKAQYNCDVTYGTNNEFGFDYLRDNMKVSLDEQTQRGFHYAVVDEVDSILIDEARTPLIIAGASEEATDKYHEANRVVQGLIRKPDGLPPDVDDDAGDWHFIIKEKEHQAILTEKGLEECERRLGLEDIYNSADGGSVDWPHHLTQALRAQYLYQRDKEYVAQDGEVIIVDDFTGRMMPGRRWSDGLHQAVEAKEGLQIQAENQTLATITLQNYFKLYAKLSGMTGTAKTEEGEFDKIYKLGVAVIPTNRPLIRLALPDVVYMSEQEKFKAIVEELARYHASGRPLLVGTASIERSEVCSALLQRRGVPHQVLNAKQHEREAAIVAKAGELGSVTIATNMAGRGTDIVLGTFERQELLNHWRENGLAPRKCKADDADCEEQLLRHWAGIFLPEKKREGTPDELRTRLHKEWNSTLHPVLTLGTHVQALGGLHILGTERHDSRRIDNQLRGRSGRQGDPGSSQFFLSLEDSLMRRFAGPKVQALLRKLGMKEGDDITSPMVSRQIEKAQGKVELHNFEIRKNLLEYDEVMNEQRKTIYAMRQDILENDDQRERIVEMMDHVAQSAAQTYMNPALDKSERDPAALSSWINETGGFEVGADTIVETGYERLPAWLAKRFLETYEAKEQRVADAAAAGEQERVTDAEAALTEALELFLSAVPEDIAQNAVSFAAWFRHRSSAELDPLELVLPVNDAGENDPALVQQLRETLLARGMATVRSREAESTAGVMRKFESVELLRTIDVKWKDHLLSMDHLRDSIGLRSYAQVDPKVEYKKEGYQMFRELLDNIRTDVTSHVMRREPPINPFGLSHTQRLIPLDPGEEFDDDAHGLPPEPEPDPVAPEVREAQREAQMMMQVPPEPGAGSGTKVGRNDPCPCGSGAKFKKCHGKGDGGEGGDSAPGTPDAPMPGSAGGAVPKVGKNKPCPCGSGKKYKACHGKGA